MKPKRTASSKNSTGSRGPAKARTAAAPCTDRLAQVTGSAADFMPANPTLPRMRVAAHDCRGCALYLCGTGAVFGEGPRDARVMFIGEQPGDVEDKEQRVFVGPAGKLLDKVFVEVGIDRSQAYLTNAVKHFKWARAASNKKRIHKSPSAGEVRACFPWLEAEMKIVQPDVIVCLGATAAKAVLGATFSVMKSRGRPTKSSWAPIVMATVHPSAVLRAPSDQRKQAMADFTADLRKVAALVKRAKRRVA
jgi:uracil-DNA glycosylase family protein